MTNLVPLSEMQIMAKTVADSKLFGDDITEQQALALMLIAQAEGCHPAKAAQEYHIINGHPSLKSDAMLARFQSSGGKIKWLTMTDDQVVAEFTHPASGTVIVDWDMKRANVAGLGGKGNWRKYPRQMLKARVISEGVRMMLPQATGSMYVPEEVEEFAPKRDLKSRILENQDIMDAPTARDEMPETMEELADADINCSEYAIRIGAAIDMYALKIIGEQVAQDSELTEGEVTILRAAYKAKQGMIDSVIEGEVVDAE